MNAMLFLLPILVVLVLMLGLTWPADAALTGATIPWIIVPAN